MHSLTPKDDFIALPVGREWSANAVLRLALEKALLELTLKEDAKVATDAAACYYRIEGAKRLAHILLNLGDKPVQEKRTTPTQLTPT